MTQSALYTTLMGVGILFICRFLFPKIASNILSFWAREEPFTKRFGHWAVVTGGTDGIGQAMAMALAREGMNVFLISRDQSRLNATKAKVRGTY